ncbi:MAG: hypothetical protein AB9842_14565 [Bacteroidales bacterium]
MPFLTLNELILRPFEEAVTVNDELRRTVNHGLQEKRIFLFYQVSDKEKLKSVVNIFKSLRLNIFIDYVEAGILEDKDPEALQVIKQRLYKASKAVLLDTHDLLTLNQYPVEYGLNGKFENTRKVILFPITEHPLKWEGKDKFRQYGYIQKKYSLFNFPDDWQVVFPEGDRILLKEWLMK